MTGRAIQIPSKAGALRRLLAAPGPIVIAGAHDGLSARLVEEAGFDGVWASGFEISASYGVPDASILSVTETLGAARAMNDAATKADAKVMLIGMRMPPNYGRDYADKFFAMYGALSKDIKAPLVPFMLDGVADKPQLFQPDRLHPLAEAHPTILANIWPTLQKTIKAK